MFPGENLLLTWFALSKAFDSLFDSAHSLVLGCVNLYLLSLIAMILFIVAEVAFLRALGIDDHDWKREILSSNWSLPSTTIDVAQISLSTELKEKARDSKPGSSLLSPPPIIFHVDYGFCETKV